MNGIGEQGEEPTPPRGGIPQVGNGGAVGRKRVKKSSEKHPGRKGGAQNWRYCRRRERVLGKKQKNKTKKKGAKMSGSEKASATGENVKN